MLGISVVNSPVTIIGFFLHTLLVQVPGWLVVLLILQGCRAFVSLMPFAYYDTAHSSCSPDGPFSCWTQKLISGVTS